MRTCDCAILPARLHGEHLSQYPPLLPSKSPQEKLLNASVVISVWKFTLTNRSCPDSRKPSLLQVATADCHKQCIFLPHQVRKLEIVNWRFPGKLWHPGVKTHRYVCCEYNAHNTPATGLPTKGEVLLCEAAFGLLYSRMRTCVDKSQQRLEPWSTEWCWWIVFRAHALWNCM